MEERRFLQIEEAINSLGEPIDAFRAELGEFFDWIECECFPFEWRSNYIIKAIDQLDKAPQSFTLLDALKEFSSMKARLDHVVEIFYKLVSKASEELRWSYQAPRS